MLSHPEKPVIIRTSGNKVCKKVQLMCKKVQLMCKKVRLMCKKVRLDRTGKVRGHGMTPK